MDGVIIFADNKVFENGSFENQLFEKFRNEGSLSVLPVCNLIDLQKTIETISTFKALILDWNFDKDSFDEDLDGVDLPTSTPEDLLSMIDIYSLIYVYSQNSIPIEIQKDLSNRFNGKVHFRIKRNDERIDEEFLSIKSDVEDFESVNKHMEIPFVWSHAINQSAQLIFKELECASPSWIKEIRDTAMKDGGDSTSEVIDVFHNLLNESLIQNVSLRKALDEYECEGTTSDVTDTNTARLYRRIYYSKLVEKAPIMTGDIFRFNEDAFGILITPECDLSDKDNKTYEFLLVKKNESESFQTSRRSKYAKNPDSERKIFNNGVISRHILISFPFEENKFDNIALIDFSSGLWVENIEREKKEIIMATRTSYKLNAPYIHQLRQRFIAFLGRYGVPSIPNSLRDFNLK